MKEYFLDNSTSIKKYLLKQIAVALVVTFPLNATTLTNNGYNLPNNNNVYANNLQYHINVPTQYVNIPIQNKYTNSLYIHLKPNIIINKNVYNIYQSPQMAPVNNNNKRINLFLNKKLQGQPNIRRMKTLGSPPRTVHFKTMPRIDTLENSFNRTLPNNLSRNFDQLRKDVNKVFTDDTSYCTEFIKSDKDNAFQTKKKYLDELYIKK